MSYNDQLLQQILSITSVRDCGLNTIEASELQEKLKLLEKDHSTILKTQSIQPSSLNGLPNLENEITTMKEDMKRILECNKNLMLSQARLEKELKSLRSQLIASNNDICKETLPSPQQSHTEDEESSKRKKRRKSKQKRLRLSPS